MKKIFLYSIISSLGFLFSGCPYESKVPIDSPNIKINPKLLGVWKSLDRKGIVCKVSKQDSFHYHLELFEVNEVATPVLSIIRKYLDMPADTSASHKKILDGVAYS